jgi:azurin
MWRSISTFIGERNHCKAMRNCTLALLVGATLSLVGGCGKNEDPQKSTPPAPPAATSAAPAVASTPPAPVKPAEIVEIQITSVANTMAFDKTKLTVPAGSTVHLTLKNNATMATLPHNWVLVKPGTEASVALAGVKIGEAAGYLDVRDKDALVHTPQAKIGESVEVTFPAPDPGDYPYICTTPGHYLTMKGVLTVTP